MNCEIYKNLVFVLYRKCNASCSMCCFESTPDSREMLDINRIKDYIDESKSIDSLTDISFTGGEPFLQYRKLLDLVGYAARSGKRIRTITNGYWADSYHLARRRLQELQNAGLRKLTVSHDNYHREYIPTARVGNVLRAASAISLDTEMTMVGVKNEKLGGIIDSLGGALNNIPLNIIPCLPVGGAQKTLPDEAFDRQVEARTSRCHYGASLVVAFDGLIYPCCSQTVFDTVMNVGDFRSQSLGEALSRLKNNALLYLLRNRDMSGFYEHALRHTPLNPPEKVVNVCELCSLFFRRQNVGHFTGYVGREITAALES